MLNISNLQENISENHKKSSYTFQIGYYYQKDSNDMEKRKLMYTFGGNLNWYSYYEKQYGGFSKA